MAFQFNIPADTQKSPISSAFSFGSTPSTTITTTTTTTTTAATTTSSLFSNAFTTPTPAAGKINFSSDNFKTTAGFGFGSSPPSSFSFGNNKSAAESTSPEPQVVEDEQEERQEPKNVPMTSSPFSSTAFSSATQIGINNDDNDIMESDDIVENIDESERFAGFLRDLHFNHYDDPFEVLRDFNRLASDKAVEIVSCNGGDPDKISDAEFEDWLIEARVWNLVDSLYSFRSSNNHNNHNNNHTDSEIVIDEFSSTAVVEESYLRRHKQARENWLILGWLQDNLPSPEDPESLSGKKWFYTKDTLKNINSKLMLSSPHSIGSSLNANTVITNIDLDAPLRQSPRKIEPRDQSADESTYKYIFELLRARKTDQAITVCQQTGNWTLNLAIKGMNEYIDPVIDGHLLDIDDEDNNVPLGIFRKPLWRRMCLQLAKNDKINLYERAIYGFLSGVDLDSVLQVSDSWETHLLTYLNYIVTIDIETYLASVGRIDEVTLNIPLTKSSVNTPAKALDVLNNSSNSTVRIQSEHLLRSVLGSLINNKFELIIKQVQSELEKIIHIADYTNDDITQSDYLLRVLVHLSLFFKHIGVLDNSNNDDISLILTSYIEKLSVDNKNELIPLYVSFFTDAREAIETYSCVLADITNPDQRKQQLKIAKQYNLDIANTLRAAVARVAIETELEYIPAVQLASTEFTMDVTPSDTRVFRSVEWFIDAAMWEDAMLSGVSLLRKFLLSGKLGAAQRACERLNPSQVVKEWDVDNITNEALNSSLSSSSTMARLELLEYGKLFAFFKQIEAWNELYAPVKLAQDLHSVGSQYVPFGYNKAAGLKTRAIKLMDSILDMAHQLAQSWLDNVDYTSYEDDKENNESAYCLNDLKSLYIPYIILTLHDTLMQAKVFDDKYVYEALQLSVLVASEKPVSTLPMVTSKDGIYRLFINSGKLNVYLQMVTEAVTEDHSGLSLLDGQN